METRRSLTKHELAMNSKLKPAADTKHEAEFSCWESALHLFGFELSLMNFSLADCAAHSE